MKVLHDNFNNTATIEKCLIIPFEGANYKEEGYRLTLTSDYDNDFLYFVSLYETEKEALEGLSDFSCNTWK